MSLNVNQISNVNIAPSWIESGLEYALTSWSQTFNRLGSKNLYKRLEKIVIGKMSEDASISILQDFGYEIDLSGSTQWYEVDRYDIGLNEFDVDVKSNFVDVESKYIKNRLKIANSDLEEWLLSCQALVPTDQLASKRHANKKLFLFVYVVGSFQTVHSMNDTLAKYVHLFWDYRWLKKGADKTSIRVGKIDIKSGSESDTILRIFGTSAEKVLAVEDIPLSAALSRSNTDFHQIFSVMAIGQPPKTKIQIESSNLNLVEVIEPRTGFSPGIGENAIENHWNGFRIDHPKAYVAGWMSDEDFRLNGQLYKRFSKNIEQYSDTLIDNYGVDVVDLSPISELGSINA